MQYSKKVIEHFRNPHNQGQIKNADAVGQVGNMACGDIMKIYLKISENKKREKIIKDIKFETLGCAAAISVSSALGCGDTASDCCSSSSLYDMTMLEGLPLD